MKKILVSACLLGTPCRYDGKSKPCTELDRLREKFRLIPVCPEVMGGLDTPRLPCEMQGSKVIRKDGADLTEPYQKGAQAALAVATAEGVNLALLKEKSPSCGSRFRYDGTFSGTLVEGQGLSAALLKENGIRVYSENEIEKLLSENQ